MSKVWIVSGVLLLLALVAFVGYPVYHGYSLDVDSQCVNNLRLISDAKIVYRAKNGLPLGAPVTWQELLPYMDADRPLECPKGGDYSINPIGTNATCSFGKNHTWP